MRQAWVLLLALSLGGRGEVHPTEYGEVGPEGEPLPGQVTLLLWLGIVWVRLGRSPYR